MNVTNRRPNIYGLLRGSIFIGKIIGDIFMRWYTVADRKGKSNFTNWFIFNKGDRYTAYPKVGYR